jgi:hypothetical protein
MAITRNAPENGVARNRNKGGVPRTRSLPPRLSKLRVGGNPSKPRSTR